MDMKAKEMTKDTMMNFATKTIIRRWGNSQGIRIPKELLREAGISLNEILDITASNGIIMLSKPFKHKTLEERAAEFDGRLEK